MHLLPGRRRRGRRCWGEGGQVFCGGATAQLTQVFQIAGDTGNYVASAWLLQRTFEWGDATALAALSACGPRAFTNAGAAGASSPWDARRGHRDMSALIAVVVRGAEACYGALYAHAQGLVRIHLAAASPANARALGAFEATASAAAM